MNRKHLQIGFALAVAAPNILAAPIAVAGGAAKSPLPQDITLVQAASKTKGAVTPAAARSALQAELRSLTPAQKKQIGEPRLAKLKAMSGNEIIAGGCTANITQGVGCKGTKGFTQGLFCCILKI